MVRTAIAVALLLATGCAAAGGAQDGQRAIAQGREAFFAQGCYGCHTLGAVGTALGPDLSAIGSKYSRADLEAWLRDPALQRPTAHMPKLELSEDEVRGIAAFLVSGGQG